VRRVLGGISNIELAAKEKVKNLIRPDFGARGAIISGPAMVGVRPGPCGPLRATSQKAYILQKYLKHSPAGRRPYHI